jgi:hypothetical protein
MAQKKSSWFSISEVRAKKAGEKAEREAAAHVKEMDIDTLRTEYVALSGMMTYWMRRHIDERTNPIIAILSIEKQLGSLPMEEMSREYDNSIEDPLAGFALSGLMETHHVAIMEILLTMQSLLNRVKE